jgi:hypothetical protein
MIIAIPSALAQHMATDLEESLICKKSRTAYPENRITIKPEAKKIDKKKKKNRQISYL